MERRLMLFWNPYAHVKRPRNSFLGPGRVFFCCLGRGRVSFLAV